MRFASKSASVLAGSRSPTARLVQRATAAGVVARLRNNGLRRHGLSHGGHRLRPAAANTPRPLWPQTQALPLRPRRPCSEGIDLGLHVRSPASESLPTTLRPKLLPRPPRLSLPRRQQRLPLSSWPRTTGVGPWGAATTDHRGGAS